MKADCETCGANEDIGILSLMMCKHRNWKIARLKYTEKMDKEDRKVGCWYPKGSLDIIREKEEG